MTNARNPRVSIASNKRDLRIFSEFEKQIKVFIQIYVGSIRYNGTCSTRLRILVSPGGQVALKVKSKCPLDTVEVRSVQAPGPRFALNSLARRKSFLPACH